MLQVSADPLTYFRAVGASIARLILYIQVLKAIPAEVPVDTNYKISSPFLIGSTSTEKFPDSSVPDSLLLLVSSRSWPRAHCRLLAADELPIHPFQRPLRD